jgi:hypothetical protein
VSVFWWIMAGVGLFYCVDLALGLLIAWASR